MAFEVFYAVLPCSLGLCLMCYPHLTPSLVCSILYMLILPSKYYHFHFACKFLLVFHGPNLRTQIITLKSSHKNLYLLYHNPHGTVLLLLTYLFKFLLKLKSLNTGIIYFSPFMPTGQYPTHSIQVIIIRQIKIH